MIIPLLFLTESVKSSQHLSECWSSFTNLYKRPLFVLIYTHVCSFVPYSFLSAHSPTHLISTIISFPDLHLSFPCLPLRPLQFSHREQLLCLKTSPSLRTLSPFLYFPIMASFYLNKIAHLTRSIQKCQDIPTSRMILSASESLTNNPTLSTLFPHLFYGDGD